MQHPTAIRSGITVFIDEFCLRKESFLKHTICSNMISQICYQLKNQCRLSGHFLLSD